MATKANSKLSTNKNDRKRGRPAGKNRVPLSLEERRARNAQYERERRNETSEAMAQLAEAACCDPQIANADLLATVISKLQRRSIKEPSQSIEDLKRINDNLESQIAVLLSRLEGDPNFKEDLDESDSDESTSTESESESDSGSVEQRPAKYRKITRHYTVHRTTDDEPRSSNQSDSNSNSQDSVWSNHCMGKTVPTQFQYSEPINQDQSEASKLSTHNDRIGFGEWRQTESREHYSYSENSNQSEDHSRHLVKPEEVQMQFQLVPEQEQVQSTHNNEERTAINFANTFGSEKGFLESLGCTDFLDFEIQPDSNPVRNNWPLDFDDFLTSF